MGGGSRKPPHQPRHTPIAHAALPSHLRSPSYPPLSYPPSSLCPLRRTSNPLPSFLRPLSVIPAQAGTQALPTPPRTPSPIHPSPLPGGRLGGGCEATNHPTNRATPDRPCSTSVTPTLSVVPAPLPPSVISMPPPSHLQPSPRHSCAPSPSFLRPLSVIPAQAGTKLYPHPNTHLHPNSSLPPFRGEVRWGVRRPRATPPIAPLPDRLSALRRTPIAPAPHSGYPATKPYPTAPANVTKARGRRAAACLRDAMTALIRLMSPEGGV